MVRPMRRRPLKTSSIAAEEQADKDLRFRPKSARQGVSNPGENAGFEKRRGLKIRLAVPREFDQLVARKADEMGLPVERLSKFLLDRTRRDLKQNGFGENRRHLIGAVERILDARRPALSSWGSTSVQVTDEDEEIESIRVLCKDTIKVYSEHKCGGAVFVAVMQTMPLPGFASQ